MATAIGNGCTRWGELGELTCCSICGIAGAGRIGGTSSVGVMSKGLWHPGHGAVLPIAFSENFIFCWQCGQIIE
jgi:hypothetical protein